MNKQEAAKKLAKLYWATETVNKSDPKSQEIKMELGSEAPELIGMVIAEKGNNERISIREFVKEHGTETDYNEYIKPCLS